MRKTKINNQTKNQTSKEKIKKTKVILEIKNNPEEVINNAKIKKPKQKNTPEKPKNKPVNEGQKKKDSKKKTKKSFTKKQVETMELCIYFDKKQKEGRSKSELLYLVSNFIEKEMKEFIEIGFKLREKIERVKEEKNEVEMIVEIRIEGIIEEKMGEFQEKLNRAAAKGTPKKWIDYCFIL
jgi:hypothetical protein